MIAGILNLDKPAGLTSFAVVARVRRLTGVRRVGHAGTLDPLATGVLLVCIGQATRVISYLQEAAKVYLADVRLGQRTDTFDSEGVVIQETEIPDTLDLSPFVGEIWQTPPQYSALKHEGRPLYAYARKGIEVDIARRRVRIDRIEVVDWQPPMARIRVWCGKGTYIRSLANDLGGHLTGLRREAVGTFAVTEALPLDRLEAWDNYMMPISAALAHLSAVKVNEVQAARLRNGLAIDAGEGECLALDEDQTEVAILRDGRPKVVFGVR
ncbi:MAG: tRNA pseudouridine(55) synthase TruB [Chloroflexi bacterium]|nr:tRNA pseudouridine(55) synthase TruB [Chloroflexota bacterium]